MIKKYSIIVITLLLSLFLILIFDPDFPWETGNKEVDIYFVDNISNAHRHIIENFNKLHKGKIKVVPIDIPFYKFSTNERKELLIRTLRSDLNNIDIFSADVIWVKRFAKWAEALEKYFTTKEISRLTPKALRAIAFDGHYYGMPLYLDVSVLFYREDLLKKFPQYKKLKVQLHKSMNWESFIQLGLNSKFGRRFYTFPADEYEGLICSYMDLLLSQDENFFNKEINFTSRASVNAAQFLSNMVNKYKISPKAIVDYREQGAYNYFVEKDGLFLRGWQSFSKDTKNLNKTTKKEKYFAMARMPHLKGKQIGSTIGGWVMMLAKNSKHKKEAVEFIKFVLKDESQKILYDEGSYLPVIKSVYSDSLFNATHPELQFTYKLLQEGIFRPQLVNYTRISDILSHYLRLVIEGNLKVTDALKSAQKEIENLRSNN
jgi:multiple sugar transport system substrate-binding protein